MALEDAWLFLKTGTNEDDDWLPIRGSTSFWNTLSPHEQKTPFDFMTSDQLKLLAFYGDDPDQVEHFLGRREALNDNAREALKELVKDRQMEESIMNDGKTPYETTILEHINAKDLFGEEEDGRIADYLPEEKHLVDPLTGNHSRDFFNDTEENGSFSARLSSANNKYRDREGYDPRRGEVVSDPISREGPREAQVLGSRPWPNMPDDFQAIYRSE